MSIATELRKASVDFDAGEVLTLLDTVDRGGIRLTVELLGSDFCGRVYDSGGAYPPSAGPTAEEAARNAVDAYLDVIGDTVRSRTVDPVSNRRRLAARRGRL